MNVFAKYPLVPSLTSSVACTSYESSWKEAPRNPALGIYQHVKYLSPGIFILYLVNTCYINYIIVNTEYDK